MHIAKLTRLKHTVFHHKHSMIRRKQKQILFAASLYSWLLLLALPFINTQVSNGTEWVQLCTQSGLKLVPIESSTDHTPESFHSLDCPCLGHSVASTEYQLLLPSFGPTAKIRPVLPNVIISADYLLPPLRAPPVA